MKTPNELKLKDLREHRRFSYKYQDHKLAVFYSKERLNDEGEPIAESGTMIDINVSGVAFVVDPKIGTHFNQGQEIYLTRLTDQEFQDHQKGIITNITKYDSTESNSGGHLTRIGVKFDSIMDTVNYKSVKSIVDIKQQAMKGLDVDSFCGLEIEEQEKILGSISFSDPKLSNQVRINLEYLDRVRFLTPEMKREVLSEVEVNVMATAIRMCTKEVIHDLLIDLSENLRDEILEQLDIQKPVSAIEKMQTKLIKSLQQKEGVGELIMDGAIFDKWV